MILDSNGLAIARSQPQASSLYLSIYQPRTLLTGRINNPAITKGAMEIAIDSISTGSIANIYSGSAMLIGSQPGWDDIGRIRVRYTNSPSGTVGIAENALGLQDNQYVSVINQVEVEAIFPRIISDPNDAENVIFFKDYDIPYTNQNLILGSIVCMGDHFAGFLENGSHDVYYTATGTTNVNGSANTFLWAFEGGTPSSSTAHTPGNVAYTAPGHYATKLTVTSAQGAVDVSYRYISIYDKPNEGTFNPILNWSMDSPSGSRSENGYTFSVQIRQQIDQIQPNAIVVIFADEFYGSSNVSIGGKPNREKIKFVGYILEDSIEYDYKTSTATFKVASISELMKQADGFSVSCETKASPATWFEIYDLSVQKAIYHYLKWHSTVNLVADVQYTGEDRKHQYFDADRTSLFDAIFSFVKDGLKGNVVSDRGGKLWIEVEPEGLENPLSLPSSMDLLKQDWAGSPQITERRSAQTSFIELNGIAFSGVSTGTYSALLSNAPSEVPLYRGKPKTEKGLILLGQDQLNTLSGNYLAMDNSRFPLIDFSLNGNYSNLDIAPIEVIKPFIAPEDTVLNVRIQNEKYLMERMDWSYDPTLGSFRPDISVRHITTGSAGITIPIPDVPDDSGFSVPDIQVPPLPDLFFPPGTSSPTGSSCCDNAALGLVSNVCCTVATDYFHFAPPNVEDLTSGNHVAWEKSNNAGMFVYPQQVNGVGATAGVTGTYSVSFEGNYVNNSTSTGPEVLILHYPNGVAVAFYFPYVDTAVTIPRGSGNFIFQADNIPLPTTFAGFRLFLFYDAYPAAYDVDIVITNFKMTICKLAPIP